MLIAVKPACDGRLAAQEVCAEYLVLDGHLRVLALKELGNRVIEFPWEY